MREQAKASFDLQAFINRMLETKDIRHRMYISFGAFSCIFSFLFVKEVLFF